MKPTHTPDADETAPKVSRRKFLTHAAAVSAAGGMVAARQADAQATMSNPAKPQANAAAPLVGKMVEYRSGDLAIPAYLSRAAGKKPAPAVLVIHEVFGLNDHIKSIADRIAQADYHALAPNFFVRASAPPPKDASDIAALRKAASSIPPEAAVRDMQAGLDYLKTVPGARKRFASIGFCMGGGVSYQLATHTKDLAGAVIFYGRTPLELVPQVSCPLLASFGELDQGIPPAKVKEWEDALKQAGKQADVRVYTGAKHGFFNDTRPEAYDRTAALDAWQRVLKFFHDNLLR